MSIGSNANYDKLNIGGHIRILGYDGINFGANTDPWSTRFGLPLFQIKPFIETNNLYFSPFPDVISSPPGVVDNGFKAFVMGLNHRIGMGTDSFSCISCTGYRLFVKDGIKTEKVKVEIAASNGWADYVFEKDYKLMPLNELETFISTNKHFPEVPTTEEAIANGIELKEMNILLLKKVEELTLYTIEQNKQLKEQAERIEKLEQKINKN